MRSTLARSKAGEGEKVTRHRLHQFRLSRTSTCTTLGAHGSFATSMSEFIHQTAIVDAGARIGAGTRVWHFCHVMAGARIGEACTLGQNVFVASTARIGDRVKIQNNVSIYDGVELEDDVFCGPSCVFTNVSHPRAAVSRKHAFERTLIKTGATIGANATIVCGSVIGRWSMVGAGAVVARGEVLDHALVVGVPARRVGWVGKHGATLVLDGATWRCPETGAVYRETATGLRADTET